MRIMRYIIFALLVLCMLWLLAPVVMGVFNIGMFYPLPILGTFAFFVLRPDIYINLYQHYRMGVIVVTALFCIGVIILGSILSIIIYAGQKEPTKNATVIVLGCKVHNDGTPTLMLYDRMNVAFDYLNNNKDSVCIASGGKGSDEKVTEASVIKKYLISKGIEESRIFTEENSLSTSQNIAYSYSIIKSKNLNKNIAIASDRFHQLRASIFAEQYGLKSSSISCDTRWFLAASYYTREILAVCKTIFLKR